MKSIKCNIRVTVPIPLAVLPYPGLDKETGRLSVDWVNDSPGTIYINHKDLRKIKMLFQREAWIKMTSVLHSGVIVRCSLLLLLDWEMAQHQSSAEGIMCIIAFVLSAAHLVISFNLTTISITSHSMLGRALVTSFEFRDHSMLLHGRAFQIGTIFEAQFVG